MSNILSSKKISETENFPENYVGLVYGSQSFTYLIACLLFHSNCGKIPRKLGFVIAIISMGLIMFLLGPSNHFDIKETDQYKFIVSAFPLLGIFQVFIFIPIIPEMIERLQVDLKIKEGENELLDGALNDKINDSYGFIFALSNFVSPNIGALLIDTYQMDWRDICDYVAYFNFIFAFLLFIFNCGPFFKRENSIFIRKLLDLKEGAYN